jgi:allantoate deiminase
MADLDIASLGRRAQTMISAVAGITAEPGRITRLYLTPEHRLAADLVAHWMREAGLDVVEDELGTLRGRLRARAETEGGANEARRLLIGSHIDSVIDAGAYDGTFGVVAGILAAEHIARTHGAMNFGIDVLAFGDEEGSRFPFALCCSSAAAGAFDPALLTISSFDGVTFADALRAYGKEPGGAGQGRYSRSEAAAYLEVHIEQGPVLEMEGEALGVVTAIAAQSRLAVALRGVAGHAGTVPMGLRHDALAAAAEIILAVERIARAGHADFSVGTVGKLTVSPGASNVVPGQAELSVDLRSQSGAALEAAVSSLQGAVEEISTRRGVASDVALLHHHDATDCDKQLQDKLAEAVRQEGGRGVRLPSGAGHDGQAMAALCPVAMLFVRCKGGISHNPAEHVSIEDMGRAVAALIRFVEGFEG